jgi:signal transduction histidine kinase
MPTVSPPNDGLQILQQVCLSFGSATEPEQAVEATIRWVIEVLDTPATVRVALPDRSGRLREVSSRGERVDGGRLRSSRRRRAFDTKVAVRVSLHEPPGAVLHILPLVAGGEAVGIVEIVAPAEELDRRMELIEAVATQAAVVFRSARERTESRIAMDGMAATVGLAAELLRARDPLDAVRVATYLCHRHLRAPVIGCLPASEAPVVIRGLPASRRAQVRRALADLASTPGGSHQVASRLRGLLGPEHPIVVEAGQALLVVAGADLGGSQIFLETVGRFLADALEHIGEVSRAHARSDSLDLGIAWTAHELRGPLLGAKAALDHVVAGDGTTRTDLLDRTRDELGQLLDLVDPLLRWSAGGGTLRRRAVDLVALVADGVDSCTPFGEGRRVHVTGPNRLIVRADPTQLRGAVSNLVRNALAYSGEGSPVLVRIADSDGWVSVCVEDQGPGVPASERELIFDPFARGRVGARTRAGKGLGLFISRRIVEAHGGTIRLLPGAHGAVFCIELPVTIERSQRSAS